MSVEKEKLPTDTQLSSGSEKAKTRPLWEIGMVPIDLNGIGAREFIIAGSLERRIERAAAKCRERTGI